MHRKISYLIFVVAISYDKDGHSLDVKGVNSEKQFSTPAKITKEEIKQSTLTMVSYILFTKM